MCLIDNRQVDFVAAKQDEPTEETTRDDSTRAAHLGDRHQLTEAGIARQAMAIGDNMETTRPAGSLVDWLVDSELDWRQLMRQTNGSESCLDNLSEQQLKRQEVIHELIQTERHHCLTLALMRQVYLNGLSQLNEWRYQQLANCVESRHNSIITNSHHTSQHQRPQQALDRHGQPVILISVRPPTTSLASQQNTTPGQQQQQVQVIECWVSAQGDPIDLERLFPALEELIAAHELLFAHLRLKLVESCQPAYSETAAGRLFGLVGPLGELLVEQFKLLEAPNLKTKQLGNGANGNKLLKAYAKFCGQHYDSSRYYKQLMQQDKGFKQFIEVSL